jgi:hypothetical protein
VCEKRRRLVGDDDRSNAGAANDKSLLGDDAQRLTHRLAAGVKALHQLHLDR